MPQHSYDYPRPALTTDICIFTRGGDGHLRPGLRLLLIKRAHDPFAGLWALPGGFLEPDEDLDACARRELKEETGVEAGALTFVANYSKPGRDPRGWTVSAAYLCVLPPDTMAIAGDDAAETGWFDPTALPPLAFDHADIVAAALARL